MGRTYRIFYDRRFILAMKRDSTCARRIPISKLIIPAPPQLFSARSPDIRSPQPCSFVAILQYKSIASASCFFSMYSPSVCAT